VIPWSSPAAQLARDCRAALKHSEASAEGFCDRKSKFRWKLRFCTARGDLASCSDGADGDFVSPAEQAQRVSGFIAHWNLVERHPFAGLGELTSFRMTSGWPPNGRR
jgi:hypothetical protein